MPDFTIQDHELAHALGVSLLDPRVHEPELLDYPAMYNTIVLAYQRLDDECARAHQAEREMRRQRDVAEKAREAATWWRDVAIIGLLIIAGRLIVGGLGQ